jgi:hypothetical protein
MTLRVMVLLLSVITLGCDSPEASRTRGGGPGADTGNRPARDIQLHEGSNQFWRTPDRIPVDGPPLEPARQAQQLSRQ